MKSLISIRVLKTFLIFLIFSSSYLIAQDYYPLEIGNRWDYEVFSSNSKTSTYASVEIVSDSLFSNGKTYFVLSDYDLTGGRYVRADEYFIYYYDENNSEEDTLYHLKANIGDSWQEQFSSTYFISIEDIDTTELFSTASIVTKFRLDGLLLNYVNLSDRFGPCYFHFPGEPPGTSYMTRILVGGIISGEEFGEPLLVNKSSDFDLTEYSLFQNYPNPFNPATKLEFAIPEMVFVSLKIYDVLGNEVASLINEEKPAGTHQVSFDAKGLSSGIYFYQLKSKYSTMSKKMIYLK